MGSLTHSVAKYLSKLESWQKASLIKGKHSKWAQFLPVKGWHWLGRSTLLHPQRHLSLYPAPAPASGASQSSASLGTWNPHSGTPKQDRPKISQGRCRSPKWIRSFRKISSMLRATGKILSTNQKGSHLSTCAIHGKLQINIKHCSSLQKVYIPTWEKTSHMKELEVNTESLVINSL